MSCFAACWVWHGFWKGGGVCPVATDGIFFFCKIGLWLLVKAPVHLYSKCPANNCRTWPAVAYITSHELSEPASLHLQSVCTIYSSCISGLVCYIDMCILIAPITAQCCCISWHLKLDKGDTVFTFFFFLRENLRGNRRWLENSNVTANVETLKLLFISTLCLVFLPSFFFAFNSFPSACKQVKMLEALHVCKSLVALHVCLMSSDQHLNFFIQSF